MPVTYDKLTNTYWGKQVDRIRSVLEAINARPEAAQAGRVVPDPQDLALGTGRLLKAAVMFTDISGFSGRRSGTPEEQNLLLHVLNLHFTEMIRIAEEYGGTVEKNTGDGLMAYFEDNAGDPLESGPKRALAAALTMMYANENALNFVLDQSGVERISFRVAIDYGPITIAQLGAARRFGGLVAIGATANIASKMLDEIGPGEVLLGEDVFKRLPKEWHQFCALAKYETGWVYVPSGLHYSFYKYTGRWTKPL